MNTSLFRARALRFEARQTKLHIRARVRQAIGPTSVIKSNVIGILIFKVWNCKDSTENERILSPADYQIRLSLKFLLEWSFSEHLIKEMTRERCFFLPKCKSTLRLNDMVNGFLG